MFAIVDIETTGGFSATNRITEVAVMVHDGTQIVMEYQSLINPGRAIPHYITGLTGISYDMVREAPAFGEIAANLYELISDKIFVAHNVNFDYNFIKEEFRRVGIEFNRPKICTVSLSRKFFPGLKSYSLGRICEHRGIDILDRHRAFGDATATAKLFAQIMAMDDSGIVQSTLKRNSGEAFLPPHISLETYQSLPEEAGVYYFHDSHGRVLYIGKAQNIKSRFKGHFSAGSKSNPSLKSEIFDVTYELTGSEFLALLLEALEIKRLWPKYNRSQKVKTSRWGIYLYQDGAGYQRFQVAKTKALHPAVYSFSTHAEAWSFLLGKIQEYGLCPKLCGIQKSQGACYAYQEKKCNGACCGEESVACYNGKIELMIHSMAQQSTKILIKEKGRVEGEHAAIYFDHGLLNAYGFIDENLDFSGAEEVVSSLKKVKPVPETNYILKAYLASSKPGFVELL